MFYTKGMVKQTGLLKKPSNMSKTDFKDWLLSTHAQNGKYLPNLKRYTYSITLDCIEELNPPPYDAFAEAYFDNVDALIQANNSEVMKTQIKDVAKHYMGDEDKLVQVVWADAYIIDIPGEIKEMPKNRKMYCQMGYIKCPMNMTKEDLKDWWLNIHIENGRLLKDLKWYEVMFTHEKSFFGSPPFDGYGEIWFDNLESLKASFQSDIMKIQFEDVKKHGLDDPNLNKVVLAEQFLIDLP